MNEFDPRETDGEIQASETHAALEARYADFGEEVHALLTDSYFSEDPDFYTLEVTVGENDYRVQIPSIEPPEPGFEDRGTEHERYTEYAARLLKTSGIEGVEQIVALSNEDMAVVTEAFGKNMREIDAATLSQATDTQILHAFKVARALQERGFAVLNHDASLYYDPQKGFLFTRVNRIPDEVEVPNNFSASNFLGALYESMLWVGTESDEINLQASADLWIKAAHVYWQHFELTPEEEVKLKSALEDLENILQYET